MKAQERIEAKLKNIGVDLQDMPCVKQDWRDQAVIA